MLEANLGIRFDRVTDGPDEWFEFSNDDVEITAGTHDLVNDGDLDFERYPFNIAVRAWNKDTEALRAARRAKWAQEIRDVLAETREFDLLLVEGVSYPLERIAARGDQQQL